MLSTDLREDALPQGTQYQIDRRDLSDRIYHVLKAQILSGKISPGQRLSLDEFAQYFDVSVTPVRDALRLLAADGLVELRQRRGAFVAQPSPDIVRQVFQVREILESAAVDQAIQCGPALLHELECTVDEMDASTIGESHPDYLAYVKLDRRFHQSLIDCLGNRKLSEIFDSLGSFTLVTFILYRASHQRGSGTMDEHRAIVARLRAGDAEGARRALRTHLRNAAADLLARIAAHTSQAERPGARLPTSAGAPQNSAPGH